MKKALSILLIAMMVMVSAVTSMAAATPIQFGVDADSGIALTNGLLKPGETYRFPVMVSLDGTTTVALTDEILDNYNFRFTNSGEGKSVSNLRLSKIRGVYYIAVEVKAGWPATQTEEEYSFKLTKKSGGDIIGIVKVPFSTGYEYASDDAIAALEEEDDITVDNDAPVYTAEQLETIGDINNYKNVTFSDDGWSYTVNITDMDNINLLHNNNAIKEILAKYEDNSFAFLTFPAGTKFTFNGNVKIDVSSYADEYNDTFFVYRYLDGKLTFISSSYDSEEEVLSFKTNTLGRFVITNKAIKDVAVVAGVSTTIPSSGTTAHANPNTGADPMSAMLALSAMVTLAGAAAFGIKRK